VRLLRDRSAEADDGQEDEQQQVRLHALPCGVVWCGGVRNEDSSRHRAAQ
jgi:hypothetical protein